MKVSFEHDPVIPDGEYELMDGTDKFERAKKKLGPSYSERELFLCCDREAVRIAKGGKPFPPQHFWNREVQRMSKLIDQFSDAELQEVLRGGGEHPLYRDWYQKAMSEQQIRQQQVGVPLCQTPVGIVFLAVLVGGILYWLGWN